ncbi:MAG: ABC transporter ATP-binding protein [Candidatus Methylacidiphilales bacterium]
MLRVVNLHKSIGSQKILRGVNLEVDRGENVVIIGRSGGGKSVLLRHLIGLLQPDEGEVFVEGMNIVGLGDEALSPVRRKVGMLFQNGALFDSFTVEENLAFPLWESGLKDRAEIRARVKEALAWVELSGQEEKFPGQLSGGMQKRVALARAAISRPDMMLYDEPTTGLDPIVSDSISKLILRLGRRLGLASIVVTHDMTSAYLIADRIDYLHEGRIYFSGTPEEVQANDDPLVRNFVRGISEIHLDDEIKRELKR